MTRTPGVSASTPGPCRPTPARAGLPVDDEELGRWARWLIERGYKESTAKFYVSRIRTACAHGAGDLAAADVAFANYDRTTRGVLRLAFRELEEFRRSA